MRKLGYLIWKIYFSLLFFFFFLILFPIYLLLFSIGNRPYTKVFRLLKFHSSIVSKLLLSRFEITGLEKLPPPPYIICPNHTSYLDIIFSYCFMPDYFIFLAKKELGKWPLFNVFFKGMNLLVDRGNPKKAYRSLQMCAERIREGESIIIFPEGGIPAHVPKVGRFKNGPFKLALETKVPIVPISFLDNHHRLSEGGWLNKAGPGKVRVLIHDALNTTGLTEEDLVSLRDRTFEVISESLNKESHGNK
jgi:1-acyl-sn-glycerol-3-phosphate acyltransferase